MKHLFLFILTILLTKLAFSANYYVAVDGSASNDGLTLETPFGSIVTAISKVEAGDTIYVRGGTYEHSSTVSISKSGVEGDTICMLAYADEKPVLNFSGTAFGKRGIKLSGSYWKIKGFEIENAGDNGMFMSGDYNTIEFCSFHDNEDTGGLQIGNGAHNNYIINCDSYYNADPTDYGDADGFAAKLDVGDSIYFYGCRAWYNVDDGWDGYMRGNDDVSTTLENCWTWCNGYFKDGTDGGEKANGNGFKVGGSDDKDLKHNFTLIHCLSFYNKAKGFDQNNNKGNMFFYNCTAYGNEGYDYSIPSSVASGKTAEVKNSVLYNGNKNLASFVVCECNSWDSEFSVDETDFVSIDTTGISGPRKSDGSLPDVDFMHLSPGSDLIDAGIDLGYSFLGSAPDLGAFETSTSTGNSIKQLSQTDVFKAYVNSQGIILQFKQENNGSAIVSIYNLSGRKVKIQQLKGLTKGKQQAILPVSLAQGIYLICLNSCGKLHSAKITIE